MTKSPKENWVVFLDMLGTKESAKLSKEDYPSKIELFKNEVVNVAKSLDCNLSMRVFSDSIYFQIDSFDELAFFCRTLMFKLFPMDVFFKGAISSGELDESPISTKKQTESGYSINIKGSAFGPSVVPVHFGQEQFKGIGFLFDPGQNTTRKTLDILLVRHLVRSAFPVANNRLTLEWQPYFDLKFDPPATSNLVESEDFEQDDFEEGIVFIQSIVQAALRAERSKKDLSRYYLSFLHTLIRSADFRKIDYFEDNWRNFPLVFFVLHLLPGVRKGILQIKGGETLYLHIAERILSEPRIGGQVIRKDSKRSFLAQKLVSDLSRNRIIQKSFPKTPSFIFSEDTRQFVAKTEVEMVIPSKRPRKGTKN
ncbi:MAG: hypothetical protein KDA53_13295 [Hyphomonas sp.]|nr:hypothetical protein [Hyphomonas sp.]